MELLKEFQEAMPYPTLRDYQWEYCELQHDAESHNKNFLVVLPTGMGKTVMSYWAAYKAYKTKRKAIILVPVRQLATELLREFPNHLPMVNVVRDTGADREARKAGEIDYENADVIVMTTERLMAVFNAPSQRAEIMPFVDYVVFDEIHKIQDMGRGSALEWVLMNLKRDYPQVNVVGLSATLPNYQEFADWLEADVYYRPPEDRPIPLEYYFTDAISPNNRTADDRRDAKFRELVKTRYQTDGQFLVFMYSKPAIEKYARLMAKLPDSATHEQLWEKGVAIHHRDVEPEENKDKIVRMFNDGELDIIFCTPTLAEGVNTAAVNVALFDLSVWDGLNAMYRMIPEPNLRQMWGRAGRAGYGTNVGRVFFFGEDSDLEHAQYCVENAKDAKSQFGRVLVDKILTAINNEIANTEEEIYELMKTSFLFFQNKDFDMEVISDSVELLLKYRFIKVYGDKLYATPKGRGTVMQAIKVHTLIDAQKQYWNMDDLTSLYDIFRIFLANEEFLSGVFFDQRKDYKYVEMAEDFFRKSKHVYEPVWVSFYNDLTDRHESRDMRNELLKILCFIFSDDIIKGRKPFTLKGDIRAARTTGTGLIDRVSFILKDDLQKHVMDHRFFSTVSGAMKYGTLDPKKLELGSISGIGEKTLDLLFKAGIDTKKKFFESDLKKLKRMGIRISEARFDKLRAEAGYKMNKATTADLGKWF